MTLVVEDGTGLANADSLLSLAAFQGYCVDRGLDISAFQDEQLEEALRDASEYASSYKRFKGARLTVDQAFEFPRTGLIDWSGLTVTGIPSRFKNGVAYLAFRGLSEPLYIDLDRGGMIKSESVGPLSTTYMDGAPAFKVFTRFDQLIAQWVRPETLPPLPFAGGADIPANFAIGQMDFPGAPDPAAVED